MKVTVILCTHNRCQSLAKALESVAAQRLPQSVRWEVLVVDNTSTDQTRTVVKEICSRYPDRFRYLFEGRPGKSHALNAGIREAEGEILAFMDDDVTLEATWLQNLTRALHDNKCAGSGGRILPEWTCAVPRWLPQGGRYDLAPFALFDLGPEAGQLNEAPFGTNMAFLKAMFEKHGGFRTDLGPRPGSMIRDEDTEFGRRLLDAGERLYYEPSAVVYHPVPDNRVRKAYFLGWWFGKGRAAILQFGVRPGTKRYFWGIPLYLFRNLAVRTVCWAVSIKPSERFRFRCHVWYKFGEITECYRGPDQRHGIKKLEDGTA